MNKDYLLTYLLRSFSQLHQLRIPGRVLDQQRRAGLDGLGNAVLHSICTVCRLWA